MPHLLLCLIAATLASILCGVLIHCKGFPRQIALCGAVFTIVLAGAWFLPPPSALALCVACILAHGLWLGACAMVSQGGRYRIPAEAAGLPKEMGKALLIVPHPDDEFNLGGGIIPSLQQGGGLFVLFVTNGDINQYSSLPCREAKGYRMREAVRALAKMGVPRSNILFLGYGNEWQPNRSVGEDVRYLHIMNAPEDAVQTAFSGERETWGVRAAPCFNPGQPYTRRHLLEDMQQAILHIRPDTLICVDDDPHSDHLAVSAAFDETVTQLQKAHPDYRPAVLKGLSYTLAWRAERLFYAENMPGSMPGHLKAPHPAENSRYAWHDCLRLPVHPQCCTRTLSANLLYKAFLLHRSQQYSHYAPWERIIRGDKIFWWHPGGNILLAAVVSSNQPGASGLTDGTSNKRRDVTVSNDYEPGWGAGLNTAEAEFRFRAPTSIAQVRIHKHPHAVDAEFKIHLRFSHSGEMHALFPGGQRSLILDLPSRVTCQGLTLRMESDTMEHSGLTEVEAFTTAPQPMFSVQKLMDEEGRFMYDYTTGQDGTLDFSLYAWPTAPLGTRVAAKDKNGRETTLTASGSGLYRIQIPTGERCTIYAYDEHGCILDAANVSNPGHLRRAGRRLLQRLDKAFCSRIPAAQVAYYSAVADWLYCALSIRKRG